MHSPETLNERNIADIKALIKKYQPSQLRLPLHAAVMISPLYLLAPIQLYTKKWDRHNMFLASVSVFLYPLIADDS